MLQSRFVTLFIHIPKTGGTSLYYALEKRLGKSKVFLDRSGGDYKLAQLSKEERSQLDFVQGHFDFGVHRYFDRSYRYITFLRDPIDRAISEYYFFKEQEPKLWIHDELVEKEYSLKEFMQSGLYTNVDNPQVRFLSGNQYAPFGECTTEMLEVAKQNLKNFSLVGLTEYFDESMAMLFEEMGLSNIYFIQLNKTIKRPSRESMDAETLAVIEEMTAYDKELYVFGKELFQEKREELGSDYEARLKSYRWKSKYYRTLIKIKNRILPVS